MHALGLLPAAPGRPAAAVLFGGERDSGLLDDLWLLQLPRAGGPGAAAQQDAPAGGTDGAARWVQLRMKAAPAPRFGHALVGERCKARCPIAATSADVRRLEPGPELSDGCSAVQQT